MLQRRSTLLATVVAVALVFSIPGVSASAASDRQLSRNVILLIDDGAGYRHHEVGSLYDTGLRQGEAYNEFPFQVAVSTWSNGDVPLPVEECPDEVGYDPTLAWTDWSYPMDRPTDSAAAATAMATGIKTYDKAIGVDCGSEPVSNVVELAEALHKSTGVVTSVQFNHATPASFVAHNPNRDDYLGLAREMINDSATDVIMGGGHPWYSRFGRKGGVPGYVSISKEDYDGLVAGTKGGDGDGDGDADPWTLVETLAQFRGLMTGETPSRVFGLAQVRRTLQQDRLPSTVVDPQAYTYPQIATVPTLAEMATGALNVLDADPDGFFLMIEGGATDWAAHDNQTGLLIEEEIAFNRSVDAVLAWVDQHSNWGETLVIVASDHETGYLTGPGSGPSEQGPMWTPIVPNGIGIAPGIQYNSKDHTNSLVPLYAKGDAGRLVRTMVVGTDPVHGSYIDNTSLHGLIVRAFGAD